MVDDDDWAKHEAKWAERDRRIKLYEAELAQQAADHRREHVETVYNALVARWGCDPAPRHRLYAEAAVDALMESGVVFARLGSWDDDE